jgi:D-glycerate 3-kinase
MSGSSPQSDLPGPDSVGTDSLKSDSQKDTILSSLLVELANTSSPSASLNQRLAQHLLISPEGLVWGITVDTVAAEVETRSHWFRLLYPTLQEFCRSRLGWETVSADLLWKFWLPLAMQLKDCQQRIGRPLIQGILGGQGTGKTTLAAILTEILNYWNLQVCQISLDDLYKTYGDRLQLQQIDPRFRWRGPPGTHDVDLGIAVLEQIRSAQFPVWIPRFDKSAHQGAGDRTQFECVFKADIVLFEGWFVGTQPIEPDCFNVAPSPIETEADRAFAREVNQRLRDYLPLWDLLDRLLLLLPVDYRLSQQWRREAEHRMIASGKSGMSDAEIEQFVAYFWRSLHPELFITPLRQDHQRVDLVVEIDAMHHPGHLYRPVEQSR